MLDPNVKGFKVINIFRFDLKKWIILVKVSVYQEFSLLAPKLSKTWVVPDYNGEHNSVKH
jgi:hypothetical protein